MKIKTRSFYLYRLLFIAGILIHITSYGQQDPIYSQFMYNGLAINPAVAGSAESLSATVVYRKQWNGIQGGPETQTLNVDAPFYHNKVGLGLSIINDKIGVTGNLTINTLYAYRIQSSKGTFAMGLQAGIYNYKADYTSVVTDQQNNTDNAFASNVNRVIFNFGSGAYFYSEKFFAGFSIPHILNQSLDGIVDNVGVQSRQYRHYFVTAGYVFDAGENFKIKPSSLLKFADGAPMQADINSNVWYKERFCLGFSYRTSDSFSTILQFQVMQQFRLGYAYDYILSNLSRFTTGNHEIMLRYEPGKKETSKIITPRYF